VRLLRGKYHQYEEMKIEENPVISIHPGRVARGAPSILRSRRNRSWTPSLADVRCVAT
jgi:uncharacterized Fe-S cluster protein YjdI